MLAAIRKRKGKLVLTTVAGGKLTASVSAGKGVLTDEKVGQATVAATILKGANGVIHVIYRVMHLHQNNDWS